MAKSPEEMAAAMIANMKEKTGKTLEEWLKLARKAKLSKHREILNYLKSEHGMTHGFAGLVATKLLEESAPPAAGDELVETQYAGAKAELRPIYDALIKAISAFGSDIEVSPKKAYVSLRRSKQFALIQPSTKTRVDVGVNLKAKTPTDRLEASGSFNAMVSHRVRVTTTDDVNDELLSWLREAYDAA